MVGHGVRWGPPPKKQIITGPLRSLAFLILNFTQFFAAFFAYEILRQVDDGVLQGHLVMAAISAGRVIQPPCTLHRHPKGHPKIRGNFRPATRMSSK